MSEPAFPMNRDHHTMFGLTKRELFAAMAMQGLLSNAELMEQLPEAPHGFVALANVSTTVADALIAELEKQA